ncbi:MAG: TetR/AcrR family transcriptional regulator, partial [Hyphomonadaceae bacterium]
MTASQEPKDVDAFILQQLELMLSQKGNRLDPTFRRERIAAAVHFETLSKNYTQLSAPAVAKRAGVSTATLYRLFPDDNALYEAGFFLGVQQYLAWLSYDFDHPNPLLRLATLLDRRVQVWTRPKAMEALSPLYYIIGARDPNLSAQATPYLKHSSDFWLAQFNKLKTEGYLDLETDWNLLEIFWGPIESLLFYPTVLTDLPYISETSKFEDCWRAVDDFLTLYGTPHFQKNREKLNWDAELAAFRTAKSVSGPCDDQPLSFYSAQSLVQPSGWADRGSAQTRLAMNAPFPRAEQPPCFEQQIRNQLSVRVRRHDDGTRSYLILAAVLQEWAEVGLLSAQMTTIAARAKVSTATLYRLFPNREEMHLEALALGQQLLVEAMKECQQHPNPVRDLLEMAQHYAAVLREPYFKQFSLSQTFLVRMDSSVKEQASIIAVAGYAGLIQCWQERLQNLVDEGFLKPASINHMIFRLIGPIEARTLHWHQSGRGTYVPDKGWLHEVATIVEAFFEIYGTKKYQTACQTLGWDWSSFAAATPSPQPEPTQAPDATLESKGLLQLESLERAIAEGPLPADFIAFVEGQHTHMLAHGSNRLDTSDRYLRIVAATLYENYRVGYEQISMAGIAKRAGVSTKTLYRTFPDDLNLYQEAHSLGLAFFSAWLSRDVEEA